MNDISPGRARAAIVDEFPVTTTQQRCWFLDQIEPGNTALNIAVRWEFRGRVSTENLQKAFQLVTDRHEILRTRFVARDGEPVQQVLEHVPFRLGALDLRTTPEADRMARIDAIAHEEGARPFDLGEAGLLRATLVRWEAERAMMLITAHQSVFDGHSIGVLGREVGMAAAAFEAGKIPDLPELPLQFGDYALWQKEYLESGVLEDEGAWWQEQLEGAPYFELPTDKPRPAQQQPEVHELFVDLPRELTDGMQARARAEDATLFAFGHAVVVACLHRLTGAHDILMGTQTAGRIDSDLDPLIGVFINNLVLRMPASPQTPLSAHIGAARGVIEDALARQSVPFNKLVERLNPVRDAARNPIISMNFNLMNVFMQGHRFETFEMISVPSHYPGAVYDLQVMMIGRPTGWRLIVQYQTALFEAETMEWLLDLLQDSLRAAVERPDMRLGEMPVDSRLVERFTAESDLSRAAIQHLSGHPMVAEATIVTEGARSWAFVTAQDTGTLPLESLPSRLMAFLGKSGEEGAQVDGVSVLAGFPRNARGDINRALLRLPKNAPGAPRPTRLVEPDAALVARLRQHWCEILSIAEVPPEASFFDLGGHSFLAVRLLTRIRQDWGVSLGIATIYEHATLSALAAVLAETVGDRPVEEADDWRVLKLSETGEATPFVSINTAGLILSTVRAFERPRPASCVRLFQDESGLTGGPRAFEDYAGDYAELVRSANPGGPFLLYGNCVHGNLALEAARILQAEGEEIRGVVMKDVWEPGFSAALAGNPAARWQNRRHTLASKVKRVREGTLSLSAMLGSYGIVRKTGILQLSAKLGLIDRIRNSDLEPFQEKVIDMISAARDLYRPEKLDLPVLHVITGITPRGGHFPESIGWEDVVTGPLKTVFIEEVVDHPKRRVGVEAFAREIETFLGETAPR